MHIAMPERPTTATVLQPLRAAKPVTPLGQAPALPRIAPRDAAALNRLRLLLAHRRLRLAGMELVLRPVAPVPREDAAGAAAHQAYLFQIGPHAGELGLSPLAESLLLGERQPRLLPLALRYALVADALADLVPGLEAALGHPFEWTPPVGTGSPGGATFPPTPQPHAGLSAGPAAFFSVAPPGQKPQCALHLRLESGAAAELLDGMRPVAPAGPGAPGAAGAENALDALRLPLDFEIGSTQLSLKEMQSIRRGDIVGIERWRAAGPAIGVGVLVGGTRMDALEAVANGNRITVETRKDPAMGIDNATPRPGQDGFAAPAPANEAAPPLARLDALEVALRFQVGELSISLGDLKSVGPGHVFELADPLNRSTVRIVAHGNVLGTGHLVAVGDRLGVRVSEFALNVHE